MVHLRDCCIRFTGTFLLQARWAFILSQARYPSDGIQLGLIASSTPFITGRPATLFKGSSIFADGAVGLALFDQGPQRTTIEFENMQAISSLMQVTQYVLGWPVRPRDATDLCHRAQTNMVEALDQGNPVESLLRAMSSRSSIAKEQDIYLGVVDTSADPVHSSGDQKVYKYSRVYKITAGGPSHGTILLAATEGPQAGAKVQVSLSQFFSL
jgi:hypothetical protein